MPRRKKAKAGRPPLGDRARSRAITVKFTDAELEAIEHEVARHNSTVGHAPVTVAGWIRDRATSAISAAGSR